MSWEGYDNSQVPYPGRRRYKNDQHEEFSSENRDNYQQENRGEYPLESEFEYQVENRVDYTSTLAQDVDYIQEQDVDVGYTQEDLRNDFDQRTNRICNSRNVFTHQWVRNKRGHQFYRGRNKHLTSKMRHLFEQENRSSSISPRDSSFRQSSHRKYSRDTRSPSSISPQCSNERLSTSPTSPHCATERKSHRFRDSSQKYSHRRRRSRSYERHRSRSKGRCRSRSPRRESRKRSCERSGRSYCGSRDNKDSYRSDYSPGRSDKNRCKSTELKVSGGSYKYSPDKDYTYSNTSRHKKSASSSNKDRKKKKTSWKKEEEDMTENLPRASDKSKIENCNDIENVVSDGIKAIRYGLVPEVNKKQEKVTRTKQAMRHKHQNNVLSEHDLECLHTKNDRYHYYRDPNNSTDKSSSNKSTDNSSSNKLIDNNSSNKLTDNSNSNKSTDNSSSNKSTDNSSSNKSTDNSSSNKSRGDKSIEKTSKETSVFDNSYKNIKVKLSSNAIKLAKSITDVCKTRITADGKRSFSDIKGGEQVSNDVKKLKLSSETSEDIVTNVNMSSDKVSVQSGCESVFTSSRVHTEVQDQSLNDNLIRGEHQKNRAHSVQSNTDMSNDNIQPVYHTKHTDAGVNKLQTHVATIYTGARPIIETTHTSLPLDTQTEVPYFTNITKENKLLNKLLNKLNTQKPLLPTPKLEYMNTAAHVTHNSKPISSWNRFHNRTPLLPSPGALHVDVMRNTCQYNEQSMKLPQDLPNKEQLDSNLSKGSVDSEENTNTSLETGQTEKTNVEENMMAIRQEQSKYQEKQGDGDCTNDVNVAVKTVGSYYVQNTSKDVVKKTEMIVDNSDDQKRKKSDQNKFKNVQTSDQKEVKVRKSDQKEMKVKCLYEKEVKVKCLYEKEVTHEKKLIKNASFNSLDNTEVLYIKHKQEKKCHSSGQVIKPASMPAANQKPSDGDNNNNVHDIGRRESSKVREHVKTIENAKQKLPTDSTMDITKDYQCSGASGITQNTVHSDKKLDTMRKSNMGTSVGEKEPSTRSDANSKSENRSIYRGKKEHSSNSTEHSSKSTEHSSKSTAHSSKSTDHSSKSTAHSSKSTEHSSKYTAHSSKSIEHSSKSTEYSSKSTEHSSKSSAHSSKSTEHSSKSTVADLQSLVKGDMSLSLESSKDQTTNIKELSMSPKNLNIENKMTSTPVAHGRKAPGHRELLLSPVESIKILSGNESIDKCRHGTGSECGKDKNKCTVTSNTISESDCSTDDFMVLDSWQEASPSKINDEKSQNETKPQPCDKEQEQTTSQINTDIDKANTVGDKFVMKKKFKLVTSSPLKFTTIKKMKAEKRKMKALAKAAAKIFKENMMSNRGKGNKDELENKETHKMSIDTESHDKLKVSPIMDKKAESHDKSNVSQSMDKKPESHDKSKVSLSMDKKAESHDKSKVSQNMDKKAESHDKSNVSQSPFHSLFGRKIRTCLEDFPLIKTPKKDKSSDDKEVLASVSNPALSLPVNVEQTHKEKLKPKKNVDKRLINVKLDKQFKYGSLTNEEMEIKTNKYSEHNTETDNNIASSKKQFVAIEEMKHVEIQDSETKKIYQQEIKLTDRSKEKSHDRNILCQTKQETKHLKCEKNNNKKEVDDLKKRDNKGNHANKKEHERNVKKEEKSHKRFKTDKEQCTMVESKTKQSTTKHKEHKTDCLEEESEIQKDKVAPNTEQSTTKHREHKTDCLEKESEIQKYKVAPKTEQSTTKHKEHKTDCLEKESEIQKDKVELKTNQSKGKLQECSQKETYLQNEKGLKTLEINYRSKHEIDQKEAKILNDEIVLKNQESNRLEADDSQTEKDNQKDCLHDENNDLSIIDSFHENEDVDVYTDNDIQSTHTTDEYDDSFECVGIIENVDLCTIDSLSFDEKEKLDNVKDVEINQNTSISTEYDMYSGEEIDENELLVDFESFGPEISQEVEIQTSFEEVCPSVVEELEISTSNEVLPCHTVQLEITNGNCAENSTDEMSTSVSVEDIGNFVGQNHLVNTDNNQESVNVVNGKIIVDNSKPDESSKSQTGLTVDKSLTLSTVDRPPPESTVDKPPTESTVDKPQTISTVGKPQTELTVDKPPTELTVDKPQTEFTIDKSPTELNVDEQLPELAVDKTPTELTFNKPPTELTVDQLQTELTVDKPPTEMTVDKSITKIQKTGETSKHKTPVNTKTVNKTTVKAITINKVHSVVMETTKCVKERDSSSQGSAKVNVMKDWKFSNKARPLKTKHVTPGKSKVMKDNTGIKHRSKSLDSTNTVNNKSTNTLNNKSVDQSFLKTSHSAVKESEIKTSTGHFRKLATQKSEKSDDLVTMPVPCSDTEHKNDSKPCQNDHQQNEASDISELKIISVCGNVDFDQPMNTEQESSLQVTENIHVNIPINDEVDDGRPTPSVDNLDQILNSTPMIKYNNITNDNVENKKDGNMTKPESNTCVEVTKLSSLVNKNKHSGSLSQTFAMMETNSNSITDESDLDSSGDKLVIDMNSKSESESTLSNSQSDSHGVDQLRMIPTETRQDLDTMATVNTTSRSSNATVSNQEMSSRAVTTENNQYLCKTEESKATGMETVSTSLEETMIYANSDLDTSKDTVEYCERRQTTDESTISNDNKEVEDYDDFDDDIQIMWYIKGVYIKGVPQSPWTSETPHIKQEMMDDYEEDDEFKQPPVLPELDEYFKQNPGIFSKMKGKGDTSVNSTSSCIVPSSQPDSPQLEDTYDNFFFNNMVENPDFRYEATPIIDDNDSNQSGQSQTDNAKIGEEQKEISESSSIKDETKPQSENNDETTTKEKVRHLVFDKDSEKFLELKKQMVIVNDKNELESTTENINDEESNNTINKTESRAINRQSESKSSLSEKQSEDDMKIYVAESLPSSDDGNNNSPRPHEGATNHSDRSPCTAHDDANITNMPQTDQESVTNESDMPPTVDIEITTNEQKRSTSTENMYDAVKHHSRQKKSTHSTLQSQKSHINQQLNAQFPVMGSVLFPPSVQSKNNEIKAMQQNQRFKLEDVAMYMREPTKKLLLSLKFMSKKLTNNGTYDFSHFKRIRFTHIKILNDGQTKNTIGEFIPAFLSDQLLRCIRCISCNGCFSPYRFMKHICNVQWTRVSEKSFQNPLIPTEVPKGSAIGVWKLLFYVLDMEKHLR